MDVSAQLVFMAVLGGFANFFGPIVGAACYILLQDQLQSLTEYWRFVLGALLALIVIAFPQRHCRGWPYNSSAWLRGDRHDRAAGALSLEQILW